RHIGRIRVESLLGAGGMGDVYRGYDETLERAVALKVVSSERRVSTALKARFLREAKMLSRVDHPNICRIHDVIDQDDASYLVLELIDGRTLRGIVNEGLGRDDAIGIALQIARALAAAHAQGVVHRDLKPDNVMITASGDVKVLDFGLARLASEGVEVRDVDDTFVDDGDTTAPDSEVTEAGTLVGTLHYMSPEQARGMALSEASDMYSFGVVLHELLTGGVSPYGESTDDSVLLWRVRRADISVGDTGDLRGWLQRLLDEDPAARPTASEMVRALEKIRARPARRRRVFIAATVAAIAIGIALASIVYARRATVLIPRRIHRVAVLPFRNATGEPSASWVEVGMMDFVARGLGNIQSVHIVPPDDVMRAMRNLSLERNAELAPTQCVRLLNALGADAMIDGSVTRAGDAYIVRYAALGRESADPPREVRAAALTDAANAIAGELSKRLDPAARRIDLRANYSADDYANVTYAIALQELSANGPKVASHYFTVCLDRDPEFAWAKAELALCRNSMSEGAEADALLAQTIDAARKKSDDKLLAFATVMRAVWGIERGQYADAGRSATEALTIARKANDARSEGRALNILGAVAWRTHRPEEARALFGRALAVFTNMHSPRDQALVYNNLGILAAQSGDAEGARKSYARVLEISEATFDRTLASTSLGNLVLLAQRRGDLAEAESLARRQVKLTRELDKKDDEVYALTNLGAVLYARGAEEEALKVTDQARALAARLGNARLEVVTSVNLAETYVQRGLLPQASALLDRAAALALADPETNARTDVARAYLFIRSGRLREAESLLDRAERVEKTTSTLVMRARLRYAERGCAAALPFLR
ncbi:MAG TPA: protein kinase, partial [Thermoanaerobaculia bacterium]|nr:protein kinase [Thermoanaerobaculia bacterium]